MARAFVALALAVIASSAADGSAAAAAAAAVAATAAADTAAARPNILFLLLDDQDSLLGSGLDVMPNYRQRFVEEGMTFANAFVSSPKCCPSRTSLLSGRFAHRLADTALGWCGDFISEARFNATFMLDVQAAGYSTALIGKMVNDMGPMCGEAPHAPRKGVVPLGVDEFFAMCNEVVYYNNTLNDNGHLVTTGASGDANYLGAVLGNRTVSWLAAAAAEAARPGGKPFFGYIAPHAPHFSAEPAPWHLEAPLPSYTAPRPPSYNASGAGKLWSVAMNEPLGDFTARGIDKHFVNRHRSLLSVDDLVAEVFAILEAAGVLDNTYVIASSDHGYHLGEFRIPFEKSHIYDTDVRVPFFVRGPGVPAGAIQEGLVQLLDVGATVMELAGATQPGERTTDGRSFAPLLGAAGKPPAGWRTEALVEILGLGVQWMDQCGWTWNLSGCPAPAGEDPFVLIDGPFNTWAMLRVINETHDLSYAEFRPMSAPPNKSATNFTELYDNAADPWQLENIASALPPAVRADLSARLWAVATCALDACP